MTPPSKLHYDSAFFHAWQAGSVRSARVIVPLVVDLLRPGSVVDIGCGVGAWLSVFNEHGVEDVLGVDGEYVDGATLLVDRRRFVAHDLEEPLHLQRSFDLAVSLEVAEHLRPESAETFVESLVRLAPVVLFSAAVPEQGGADHRNEQWPEYWAELFARQGYEVVDCVRPRVWSNPDVEVWYAQNVLLYVERSVLARYERLAREPRPEQGALALVHPRAYLSALSDTQSRLTTRTLLAALPHAIAQTIRWRLRHRSRDGGSP